MTIQIDLYSDVHCPYGYLTAYRLKKLRSEYQGKISIIHRSLALEYVNSRSTPRVILNTETPVLMLEEPDIPYQPWAASDSEWPVTMWPAFEAVKCAERQGDEPGAEMDWVIRKGFFAESRCISMRHVLFEMAEEVGLDMRQFGEDFDSGVCKRQVLDEAHQGWRVLKVEGSPTFVLPSGEQKPYFALPKLKMDPKRNYRVYEVQPSACSGEDCLDMFRNLFNQVIGS